LQRRFVDPGCLVFSTNPQTPPLIRSGFRGVCRYSATETGDSFAIASREIVRETKMADYYPLLKRALAASRESTTQARERLYSQAREGLFSELQSAKPPFPHDSALAERMSLEDAIERIEAENRNNNRGGRILPFPRRQPPLADKEPRSPEPSIPPPDAPSARRPATLMIAVVAFLILLFGSAIVTVIDEIWSHHTALEGYSSFAPVLRMLSSSGQIYQISQKHFC
jgi:hypothetical protein